MKDDMQNIMGNQYGPAFKKPRVLMIPVSSIWNFVKKFREKRSKEKFERRLRK